MINRDSKSIILLTNSFPYGKGEQFLETEIEILSNYFEKIYLFPIEVTGNERKLPRNVEVIILNRGQPFSVKKMMISHIILLLKIIASCFSSRKKYKIKGFKFHFNNLLGDINDSQNFLDFLKENKLTENKVYSYWFGPWGNIMTLINYFSKGKIKFQTRVHGYDYDIDQHSDKLIPFRNFQMKNVDAIFPVSQFAVNRLAQEYPEFRNVKLHRLGVTDHGDNPFVSKKDYHIVTCSSLIPLKRVHLVVDILSNMSLSVKWTHFGSGPLMEDVQQLSKSLPVNIEVDFKGHVDNASIIDFYKTIPVDLFVNVSELEGIPVSIMEAISFGIPVVGCDVCGVPEIVTKDTGLLLPKDFSAEEVAVLIEEFLSIEFASKLIRRSKVKEFWSQHFNAQKNYINFIEENLL